MRKFNQYITIFILSILGLTSQMNGQTIDWQDKVFSEDNASADLTAVIKNNLTEVCYVMISQEYYVKKDSLPKAVLRKLNTRFGNNKLSLFLNNQATRLEEDSINSFPEAFIKKLKPKERFDLEVITTRSQLFEAQRELNRRLLIVPVSFLDKIAPNFEEVMKQNRFLYEPKKLTVFWGDLSVRFRSSRYGMEDSYEWQKRIRTPLVAVDDLSDDLIVPSSDCDVEPQFPGGRMALVDYLQANTEQQKDVTDDTGMPGRVTLTFVVELDGSIANIQDQKSNSGTLTKAATRIVEAMPKWKPAKWRGKAVRSRYTLPITFMP